jgi:hypothetical protein
VKELCPNEIVEHERADRYVHAGQSFDLRRRQSHARHLEVLRPYAIECVLISLL